VVVVTDDDHGWRSAAELVAAGFEGAGLVDARDAGAGRPAAGELDAAGVAIHTNASPLDARGRDHVDGLVFRSPTGDDAISCDLVALAMRPEPVISLLAGAGATTRYDERLGEWLADRLPEGVGAAGHVLGLRDDVAVADSGVRAGRAAAGGAVEPVGGPSVADPAPEPAIGTGRKQFVCLCEDVTVKELKQGVAEGFDSLETLKRYSTVTMGPCQGKMCHGLAARIHTRVAGGTPASTGLTTSRPPFQPVPLAVLAGPHLAPVRRTAMHDQHDALGARWIDMGDWKRPFAYGSVDDEVRAVREAAGLIDVSTLGKLDVQGRDAGAFLDWLHPNRFSDLKVGRVRYRAMLDDAGIILDDGTVARLGEQRFLVSTTTGNLDAVDQWFGWWLAGGARVVDVTNVTSQLAAVNLAGPRAREILARVTELDVSREAMPYLAAAEGEVAGIPAVLLRIGFVGEVGFEIHVPADYGAHLWDALMAAGKDLGLRPFGVEAQRVLRLEKQHAIVGQDTDALSMPVEAGMGWTVEHDKDDFIGRAATLTAASGGQVLTGFEVLTGDVPAEGSAIVLDGRAIGRVTSSKWSPTLQRPIGLCWLAGSHVRDGAPITIRLGVGTDGRSTAGRVRTRPFYDPDGERLRA
jgi:sarcosine oxidase subunit alpha